MLSAEVRFDEGTSFSARNTRVGSFLQLEIGRIGKEQELFQFNLVNDQNEFV
jgi:hypothetical protein